MKLPAANRPVPPPPSVPLSFLAAAGVGLVAFGFAIALAADRLVASPTHPGAVSAVHVGVLAFLTTAILGVVHQITPVTASRPLRSVRAARVTQVGIVTMAWVIPASFAHGPAWLVAAGGILGLASVGLAAWNVSGPLVVRRWDTTLTGLRASVTYLVATVSFGVVYAFSRDLGWFPLVPHRVLAHAHLGLLGWMALTYVAVADRLWPMFFGVERSRVPAPAVAVALVALGVPVLTVGLLWAAAPVVWVAGVVAGVGLVAHLVSLIDVVGRRARPVEVLHGFLAASSVFLVAALVLAGTVAMADLAPVTRMRLVSAEVAALVAWLTLAVVGHAHRIVPSLASMALRAGGVRDVGTGLPLEAPALVRRSLTRAALVVLTTGQALVIAGLMAGVQRVVALGGTAVCLGGGVVVVNLGWGPGRARRAWRVARSTREADAATTAATSAGAPTPGSSAGPVAAERAEVPEAVPVRLGRRR